MLAHFATLSERGTKCILSSAGGGVSEADGGGKRLGFYLLIDFMTNPSLAMSEKHVTI
jgi:hypothetical protein